jgi:UDP:flavonoid glycosyltransferase YjiC (YdhE family)
MLIMPYSHDQPDNARRMRRLKVGLSIMKARYTPARVARKLKAMLMEPRLAQQAARVAEQLRHENGVKTACDALERLHAKTQKVS